MARHKKEHHEEHPDERWLVTFADMMVLLVAVFIVLWAMSSANVSKTLVVAESVSKALSSPVITGGVVSLILIRCTVVLLFPQSSATL